MTEIMYSFNMKTLKKMFVPFIHKNIDGDCMAVRISFYLEAEERGKLEVGGEEWGERRGAGKRMGRKRGGGREREGGGKEKGAGKREGGKEEWGRGKEEHRKECLFPKDVHSLIPTQSFYLSESYHRQLTATFLFSQVGGISR